MSVTANYVRINEDALEALRGDDQWMEAIYGGRVPSAHVLSVDKACNGIIWLLSRMPLPSATPVVGIGFVVRRSLAPLLSGAGGMKELHMEAPYGPPSVLTHRQVNEMSDWLGGVDFDQLRTLYDPQAMHAAGIYPDIWIDEGPAAFDEYLLPHLRHLRDFFAEAATAEQNVVVFFT
jgi:hypothetical protein